MARARCQARVTAARQGPSASAPIAIEGAQGGDEAGQPQRRRRQVKTAALGGDLAGQPRCDAPLPGIPLVRRAFAGHGRDGQRQPPGQYGKPPVLLAYLFSADTAPGKPDR